ncbi:MAG: trigger factor [Lachnospiraceae bacterium]|jgi:trigger factor
MSVTYEKLEHSMAKITVTVPADEFTEDIKKAYQKIRGSVSIPGFRKGKAPMSMIEKMYGPSVFYQDAVEFAMSRSYGPALDEIDIEVTSRPEVDPVQVEKGKDFIYTATVAIRPEVTLGQYKGIEVPKSDVTVTDEEVDRAVEQELKKNARSVDVTEGAVEDGDTVIFDFDGYVDGEQFDGGKAEKYPLHVGSGSFIPGFEEQVIGKTIGEEFDVNVTFPETYHAEELKGKEAVFKCLIHEIKREELPVLDDEFASNVSDFETVEEYKADLRKNLEEDKAKKAQTAKEDACVQKLIETSEMDIADPMIDNTVDNMISEYQTNMAQQGLKFEDYLKYMGMTADQFREQMRPNAIVRIKSRLVLEKVAELESLKADEERLNKYYEDMAKAYNMEAEQIKNIMGAEMNESVMKDLAVQEAISFLADNAVETEVKEETPQE